MPISLGTLRVTLALSYEGLHAFYYFGKHTGLSNSGSIISFGEW